jgi:hypothetical protein
MPVGNITDPIGFSGFTTALFDGRVFTALRMRE